MKIAIIGAGNVGGALATGWARKGHEVHIGARNSQSEKVQKLLSSHPSLEVFTVEEAVQRSEVILLATPPAAVKGIVDQMGDVSDKVIIDAMNSVFVRPEPYANTGDALLDLTNSPHVVKCFNTTGFENMLDPVYDGSGVDMFMAGDSDKAKQIARSLALDLGFAECYDMGGKDKFPLIEQFAMCWINLAIMQGEGRNMAFRLVKR